MRLTGVNTYTGNISVNAGTLELAQDAQLKFVIGANGVANKITGTTGTGMVSLDGKFNLDISGANTTTGNQWLLVDVDNLFENFGPNFRLLVGAAEFTPASGVHTLIVGSKKWTFTEATGILSVAPSSAYQSWADANAGGQTAEKDYDGDGVANGVEWVVGGSGTTNDLARLPAVAAVGGDMTFTFKRDRRSISPETTVAITVGTTLAAWPDSYPVEATSSGAVTVSDNGDGTDTITLTVVRAPDVHKFARLEVTITAP